MDIFRSKEVYRKVRKRDDVNSQDPIIPVRGMYVVGQYLVPEYKGSGIEITGIDTVKPRIVDFTTRSEDATATHITRFLNFTVPATQPTIQKYTSHSEKVSDHITRFLGFNVNTEFSVMKYSRIYTAPTDHITRFLGFNVTPIQPTLTQFYHKPISSLPEPALLIRNIKTGTILVEDEELSTLEDGD